MYNFLSKDKIINTRLIEHKGDNTHKSLNESKLYNDSSKYKFDFLGLNLENHCRTGLFYGVLRDLN